MKQKIQKMEKRYEVKLLFLANIDYCYLICIKIHTGPRCAKLKLNEK